MITDNSSSAIESMRSGFIANPDLKFNVDTKTRKSILLNHDTTIIHHGCLYDIKFKSLGGGVFEIYKKKRKYK